MATKINVEIKNNAELLDKQKAVQAKQRQTDKQKQEQKKQQEEAEKAKKVQKDTEDEEWKGAVADPKEDKKRKNRPKLRQCGHWIYKDFVQGRNGTGWELYPRVRYQGDDIIQYSVGSGDGTKWETHYVHAPSGRNWLTNQITGSMDFIGYLSYIQYYQPGSAFGTVYTLPEGAIETPYDPMVYLQSSSANWGLYFPDELNSGPAKYRRMVTLQKQRYGSSSPDVNQAQVCFPINSKRSIIIVPTWLSWVSGLSGENYYAPPPSSGYFLHPQNTLNASVRFTVYYKIPGENTGWSPINGFYWLMNPENEEDILSVSELSAIMPLSNTYTFSHNHKWDIIGFAVSHNNVKKLSAIPNQVLEKIRARYPEAPWDTTSSTNNRYNFYDVVDKVPGYPSQIDEIYNIESWEFNPDSQCMGVARNLFTNSSFTTHDAQFLPYDYWLRDTRFPTYTDEGDLEYSSMNTHMVLGISPGAYDYYDADLQDHAFYNHFGKGDWYDSWDFTYSTRDSWISSYGDIQLHTKDVLLNSTPEAPVNAWHWFYNIKEKMQELTGGSNRTYVTKNDIAWMYLNKSQREAYVNNYKHSSSDSSEILDYALQAPENPEFNYMYIKRDVANNILPNGVKWISEGGCGSWTSAEQPEFDPDSDPFYDQPYMSPTDSRWQKYRLKHKLSTARQWPPSISAGISDPIPVDASAETRADHPLAKGTAYMTLVMNTSWDNDYSEVLLEMGFTNADLEI